MAALKNGLKCLSGKNFPERMMSPIAVMTNQIRATQNYCTGFTKYLNEFMIPFMIATNYFGGVERSRLFCASPFETIESYMDLLAFNMDISSRHFTASMQALNEYSLEETPEILDALKNTFFGIEGNDLESLTSRHAHLLNLLTYVYPKAIKDVEPEFGFHFERPDMNEKIAETDRFILYRVLPVNGRVETEMAAKPVLIIPPFVLGPNILSFLPYENKSYAHCFANMGFPTYIRVMKDILETPALQEMTPEDDTRDTRIFCEKIMKRHGKPVTLNGYCQGGYMALCNLLSGELDGLVDALLTCVSPMDGTRSTGLGTFLRHLPQRFNDLVYGTKTLPNGGKVADGKLMGWVYKLKSIEAETPVVAFLRDMKMLTPKNGNEVKISKTALAINYWLENDRTDLPMSITNMSFASYNTPISDDGTLPVKLFNRKLNLKRIAEKKIPWLICYGARDDLVEKETALAPLDYVKAEISEFPKGHVAIATSWSNPRTACALHTVFGPEKYRGPVRFHIDLDEKLYTPEQETISVTGASEKKETAKKANPSVKKGKTKKSAPKRKKKE